MRYQQLNSCLDHHIVGLMAQGCEYLDRSLELPIGDQACPFRKNGLNHNGTAAVPAQKVKNPDGRQENIFWPINRLEVPRDLYYFLMSNNAIE